MNCWEKSVYAMCIGTLTFADDKIVDEMITHAWVYDNTALRIRERAKDAIATNPRRALIEEAFDELKERIEDAIEEASNKKKKENKK